MPNTLLIAFAVVSLAAGQAGTAPAVAPQPAASETTTIITADSKHASETVRSSDADEKVVCRNERAVGSNMIKRVCKSAAERKRDTQAARDAMQSGRGINRLSD
jgi:hypothetical protein